MNRDTALMIASKKGHKEVVGILLSAGANVNHQNNVCELMIVMMKNIFSFCILCDGFVLTFINWFLFSF